MNNQSYISLMSNLVKENGGINLAQGIPAFSPPRELLEELENLITENVHQYAPGLGINKLREQIHQKFIKQNASININNIMITNGATEAISLTYTYLLNTSPNRKLTSASITPSYESYLQLPNIFGQKHIEIEENMISCNDFSTLIEKENIKLLFIGLPGNPLGKILSEIQLNQIFEYSLKYDINIIFDNVYEDFLFKKSKYKILEKLDNNIFYINSFSKIFSITGWRIGFLIAKENNIKKIAKIHDYIGLSSPTILQEALASFIKKTNFGADYINKIKDKLQSNYQFLSEELKVLGFKIHKAHGGYFIWAELPENTKNAKDFCLNLYEKEKVAIVPGIHFSDKAIRFVRINIAREETEIKESIKRIKIYLNSYCSK
jgi:aspartate/methionine/tyrosine aminotransferase